MGGRAASAVATASGSLRDLRVAEVTKLDVTIGSDGKVESYRARLDLSFKYEAELSGACARVTPGAP